MVFIYLWQNDMSSQSCEKEIVKICIIIDYLNIMKFFFTQKKKNYDISNQINKCRRRQILPLKVLILVQIHEGKVSSPKPTSII